MIVLMKRLRLVPAFVLLATLSACSPSPRFTHVDVGGLEREPYVFFDQKTHQICWGAPDPDLYPAGRLASINVTKMPLCKDLP